MNYKKFKQEWLKLMQVAFYYGKAYLEQDINDGYTMFKEDPVKHKTPKAFIEFFYVDFAEHKHPYWLKSKAKKNCTHCNGKGYDIGYDGHIIIVAVEIECRKCNGTGLAVTPRGVQNNCT